MQCSTVAGFKISSCRLTEDELEIDPDTWLQNEDAACYVYLA